MTGAALGIGVGAEPGIGPSLCRRFANEALHGFAAGRTAERLESLAASSRAAVPGDVLRAEPRACG